MRVLDYRTGYANAKGNGEQYEAVEVELRGRVEIFARFIGKQTWYSASANFAPVSADLSARLSSLVVAQGAGGSVGPLVSFSVFGHTLSF